MEVIVERYNWWIFPVILFVTCLPFIWLRRRSTRDKIYVIPFILFFFVYSGYGCGWESCDIRYLFYYFVWMLVFGLTLSFFVNDKNKEQLNYNNSQNILIKTDFFPLLYILITLLPLLINGKWHNILSPPTPNLTEAFHGGESSGGHSYFYYLEHLINPFYIVCLYRYKEKPIKLFFFFLFPFYLSYVNSAYLARSTLMAYFLIYLAIIYIYIPKIRKKLILSCVVAFPLLAFGLSWYTYARLGHAFNLSLYDSISLLLYQETSYTTHFTEIQKLGFNSRLLGDYMNWFLTLPFPGFLKDSSRDYFFNAIFTEKLTGVYRGEMGFSVLLPGVVNEGLFIFGNYLFVFHSFLIAFFVGLTYKLLRYKQEMILLLYCSIFIASLIARAGTVSAYPIYMKDMIMYFLAIYILRKWIKI